MIVGLTVRAHDAVGVEVMANHFRAIVDEMAWTVLRSAHTTFVKETQDFSTGLITTDGEVFAYPHSSGATPHVGIQMAAGTRAFENWEPGDVLLANDPYLTGGMIMHLNDLYLLRPVFVDGRLLCFAWAFIHCTDVGGAVPGSIDMWHHEIFQEGLRVRPVKLYRGGERNEDVWNLVADNCRIPALNWGDLSALLAALSKADRRLGQLAGRRGREAVAEAVAATIDRTEEQTRAVLRRIPPGTYTFTEYFEDDYATELPVRLRLALTARGDGTVELDFTGSDPQVHSALNLPTGGQRHHPFLCLGLINYVVTHAPGLHLNGGILRCIDLVLPEASVVNAAFPAAVGLRYTTARRIHDLVLGALARALDGQVPAGGMSTTVVTYVATREGLGRSGRVVVANPVQGGSGGGPALDGVSGVDFPSAFLRNVPVEVLESEAPVIVRGYGLRPDTEGAGRWRGGFGATYRLQVLQPLTTVVMRGKDRHRFVAFGAHGGEAGTPCANRALLADGNARDLGKRTVYEPEMGEVIEIETGGGGGYGSPLERPVELVERDWEDGLLTAARAYERYGVVFRDGQPDHEATDRRRRELAEGRSTSTFDVGAARAAWERSFGPASARIAEYLPSLPAPLRRPVQERIFTELSSAGPEAGLQAAIYAAEAAFGIRVAGVS